MKKRLDRNGSTGASQCKYASVEANGLKLSFFEQSAVILPAFL